jgi:hypothetical protein
MAGLTDHNTVRDAEQVTQKRGRDARQSNQHRAGYSL